MEKLIRASSVDHLGFLSAEDYTHEYVEIDNKVLHRYMLIHGNDQFDSVIASLRRLVEWCNQNSEAASDITDYVTADELLQSISDSFFTLHPNSEAPGDEGQGPDFLFCTLRTVEELLKFAKSKDVIVVYDNYS